MIKVSIVCLPPIRILGTSTVPSKKARAAQLVYNNRRITELQDISRTGWKKMVRVQRQRMLGTRRMEDMTEKEAAELAMLIDTDGCIYATKRNAGVRVGMCGVIPTIMATVWGGRLHKGRTRNQYMYTWALVRRELLRPFLMKIKPHLRQKRKQAELALKMCDILDEKPEGYEMQLDRLREEISRLNHTPAPDIDITKLEGVVENNS